MIIRDTRVVGYVDGVRCMCFLLRPFIVLTQIVLMNTILANGSLPKMLVNFTKWYDDRQDQMKDMFPRKFYTTIGFDKEGFLRLAHVVCIVPVNIITEKVSFF